jgi:hypothetical protein
MSDRGRRTLDCGDKPRKDMRVERTAPKTAFGGRLAAVNSREGE